jgi:glyoxylase-like metal-dependent hydrolase (beta-lactamase superfamily II)
MSRTLHRTTHRGSTRAGAWLVALLALAAALPAIPAAAEPVPYELQKLAEGVWVVVRRPPPGTFADSNTLVVVNEADIVVVDANILPSAARQVVAEIRRLSPLPVSYVINTHWHSDHHYGNQVYREAYPGVEIVQHPRTRELVIEMDIPSLEKNLNVEYPAAAERLRQALSTGKRSNGEPVTDSLRRQFENTLGMYETFIADMKSTPVVPGTLTVEDRLVLHRAERTIEVRFLGRGNTPGDLVVYLPKERIVATGDLVVHPIPFAFFSHLQDWPRTLRRLHELDAATLVFGHGEVQRDWGYVDRLIALFESTWQQVERAVRERKDLEATLASVDLDEFLSGFGGERRRGEFDGLFRRPAVEAAFKELTGEAPTEATPPGAR